MEFKNYTLKEGDTVKHNGSVTHVYDEKGNEVYWEDGDGYWTRSEYDEKGNEVRFEDSSGYWSEHEYEENGKEVYHYDSNEYWLKHEYDVE